ncbi:threonine synthase [Chondrinema litorale]|uniref:threonine synthase n=1 Tax=Chondrinema litorale TaxID=2994555 RepID=UPI0025429762|nr:threonine synthase [Chondrinema litorale]UZR95571.1 threonine synthase [Chondrinema litorale]
MKYYSTNHKAPLATLKDAVIRGLAPDKGLYMPESIPTLPESFFKDLHKKSLPEIGFTVANGLFGDDVEKTALKKLTEETLNFEIPLVKLSEQVYSLELFHGPTCAFKDVGGRFMARMLAYFTQNNDKDIYVLTATSGDTGSAVASGFYNVPGIKVIILYPKGKVSHIQEQQLTTHGKNITALEIDGTFDDCQKLVKEAFNNEQLRNDFMLTSANSINLARFLPQSFYYYHAVAQLGEDAKDIVFSVPSGNFGNLTGGLFAWTSGLAIKRFIAATNVNDIVPEYLESGEFNPRPSIKTLANAMDVGNPSNFARMLDLFKNDHDKMAAFITGYTLDDEGIKSYLKAIYEKHNYIADPHGAIGYAALEKLLQPNETGIFLETAHPAKFIDTTEEVLGKKIDIPERLELYLKKKKEAVELSADFQSFQDYFYSLK